MQVLYPCFKVGVEVAAVNVLHWSAVEGCHVGHFEL